MNSYMMLYVKLPIQRVELMVNNTNVGNAVVNHPTIW
jgi:hypothetical protein